MRDQVTMAAVSADTHPEQTTGNLEKIAYWVQQAAESGAELILFPELSLTGFIPNHPLKDHDSWLRSALVQARKIAEPLDGRSVTAVHTLARKHNILISVGLLEDAGNLLHNTQIILGPDGLVGRWRKMHVPMYEMPFYNGGGMPDVVQTPFGRIGINICFDALLPESTRLLALQNVEFVLFPFAADPPPATPQGWRQWAEPALAARCRENGVFGLACNLTGQINYAGANQNFHGGGLACDPSGEITAEWPVTTAEPTMLLTTFRQQSLQDARSQPEYLFPFRRPELYGPLAAIGEMDIRH